MLLIKSRVVSRLLDVPNDRSLHVRPVPRIGGAGMLAGVFAGWLVAGWQIEWWIWLPLLILFAVSLLDDLFSLPVRQRMIVHVLAAGLLVWGSGLSANQGILAGVIILFAIIWMTNLFNFMDGSNGLAGGMAMIGFGVFGIAAWQAGSDTMAWLNFCIVAASLVFLFFNFQPARVFMGDAGSIPLGFLVAAFSLAGWQQQIWPVWFPLLVFGPFIVDATVTLLRRTLRGVKITEAHREHYYQRLIQGGMSHQRLALAEYGLMLAMGVSALMFVQKAMPWMLIMAWAIVLAGLMLLIDIKWKRHLRRQNAQA